MNPSLSVCLSIYISCVVHLSLSVAGMTADDDVKDVVKRLRGVLRMMLNESGVENHKDLFIKECTKIAFGRQAGKWIAHGPCQYRVSSPLEYSCLYS